MPSVQTKKTSSHKTKPKAQGKTTKVRSAQLNASTSQSDWEDVRKFFDEIETKLEKFGDRIDRATSKIEHGAETKLRKTQDWVHDQVVNLQTAERKVERLVDTARVRAHLGKMEATEATAEMMQRVDRLKDRIDHFANKASCETAEGLKKLSDACLKLRDKMNK